MIWQAVTWLILIALGVGGCAGLPMPSAPVPAYESTACGVTADGVEGKGRFYPPGQRETCLRVLTALADLKAQRKRDEISELAFLARAVTLLNGPDATAVLAASTAPNGGWLGERKHAYEQALEAASRAARGAVMAPRGRTLLIPGCARRRASPRSRPGAGAGSRVLGG